MKVIPSLGTVLMVLIAGVAALGQPARVSADPGGFCTSVELTRGLVQQGACSIPTQIRTLDPISSGVGNQGLPANRFPSVPLQSIIGLSSQSPQANVTLLGGIGNQGGATNLGSLGGDGTGYPGGQGYLAPSLNAAGYGGSIFQGGQFGPFLIYPGSNPLGCNNHAVAQQQGFRQYGTPPAGSNVTPALACRSRG